MGKVWFDPDNSDGCNSFNITIDGSGDPDIEPSPIVLVERGNCPFTKKVRNIEHAGGRLAVLIDNTDEEVKDVIMVDDGTGNGIRIPSMLISKDDGDIIKTYIKKNSKKDGHSIDYKHNVAFLATFEINKPDNRVEYDFWYTSSDDRALDFFRDFRPFHDQLDKKALITPHFAFWTCKECDETILKKDCFGNGKYCAIDE